MTHQEESAVFEAVTAILIERGPTAMASAVASIMNCAFYLKSLKRGIRSERAMTQVSRAAAELNEELAAWWNRLLSEITYLILDARYEKVRHGGAVVPCAVLTAIGVTADGKRSVLGCSVPMSEAEMHWREFLQSLQDRSMYGVKFVVSVTACMANNSVGTKLGGGQGPRLSSKRGHFRTLVIEGRSGFPQLNTLSVSTDTDAS